MKSLKTLLVAVISMALVTGAGMAAEKAAEKTCCEKAAEQGKECTHKCCVEAKKEGKTCEKCNPKKAEKKELN